MRRQIVRVICDLCGTVQEFETLEHGQFSPGVATLNVGEMIERHGWKNEPLIGAGRFRRQDVCSTCQRREQRIASCEHGVAEGDWCSSCNAEYKAALKDPDNVGA